MGFLKKFIKNLSSPDLNTLDGIMSIPNKQSILKFAKNGTLEGSILATLQKKATEHKKNNRMDLAIACLEKSFYIMLNSDYYYSEYADRYIKFLKNDRQFDKARSTEKILEKIESEHTNTIPDYILSAKQLGTDLIEASYTTPCDSETAKYRGRIFSISGHDQRFPALSQKVRMCDLTFYPFVFGASIPMYCEEGAEIEFSNRPFLDDRKPSEKREYNEFVQKQMASQNNEDEYYWIYENLPELAPKSLSGYIRMKNSKSTNFQKIVAAAKELGYEIS